MMNKYSFVLNYITKNNAAPQHNDVVEGFLLNALDNLGIKVSMVWVPEKNNWDIKVHNSKKELITHMTVVHTSRIQAQHTILDYLLDLLENGLVTLNLEKNTWIN